MCTLRYAVYIHYIHQYNGKAHRGTEKVCFVFVLFIFINRNTCGRLVPTADIEMKVSLKSANPHWVDTLGPNHTLNKHTRPPCHKFPIEYL